MLLVTQEDFADLVECATLIHDNLSMSLQKIEPSVRLLVQRDMRLAHKIEGYFRSMVVQGGVRLDFSRVWESYEANSALWVALGSPNQRWIVSNVRTLGRMPSNYLSHPVYREILGEVSLAIACVCTFRNGIRIPNQASARR